MLTLDARGYVFMHAEKTQEGTHIHIHLLLLYTLPVKLLTRVILFQLTTEILRVAFTNKTAAVAYIYRCNNSNNRNNNSN